MARKDVFLGPTCTLGHLPSYPIPRPQGFKVLIEKKFAPHDDRHCQAETGYVQYLSCLAITVYLEVRLANTVSCIERDQCCILTKKDEPIEVAYIFPHDLSRQFISRYNL